MPVARDDLRAFLQAEPGCMLVEIATVDGSTPREAGAWMLVSQRGSFSTIGGGQLEFMAIDHARRALRQGLGRGGQAAEPLSIPLGPEIGQCCGGRVGLVFETLTPALAARLIERCEREIAARPCVHLFGAGHVGNALALALSLAPVRTILLDGRAEELAAARVPGVETRLTAMPEAVVREAPAGSAFVVLTHDHALDFLIAAEALRRDDAAYVGMIGSKTKRATFRSWLTREVGHPELAGRLVCPIGGSGLDDKRPAVIAALATAEILTAVLAPQARARAAPGRRPAVRSMD
ncbi:xanthine dehydrogenase accessory protein XdhC (plasmid) [Rhizobium sp. TRM96647]|uniref:xanthine dehydrogenase accessory protein XdhC n=1 Tax=unclassified Rhizobium TaxID=2613769 RepID=UPI0021E80192|nr:MULTISPECIES: xanthine dehydrogenase accessory protein XdhC [unclassified Rhizobium]MCV3735329.1 xanthine dehydrogenase accessory protein XdhC [Rhizobium sp. TRM96647]MCV3757908.1 xanthine dehydrogenase accessory protein XdhC [Rhizobium sp. TRM96650]